MVAQFERALIIVDVTVTEGLNGVGVQPDDWDELIDVLLCDVHGFFEDDPLHAVAAGRGCE